MKSLLTGLAILGLLAACSSKTKTAETTTPAPTTATPATTAPVKAEATSTIADKKSAKKAKIATETAATSAKVEGKLTCTAGNEVRTLEVKASEGKACEVIYTKAGESKSIATAITDTAYCDSVTQKVSKNLEAAGYKCE